MVEIVHNYKRVWSMFTLASLLNKTDPFRLHLYISEDHWRDREVKWVLDNFNDVMIYQVPWKGWTAHSQAKTILHLKEWWKNKRELNKRIVFANGPRIFLGRLEGGNLPPEEFFKSLSSLSINHQFEKHPHYKGYYNILGINFKGNRMNDGRWRYNDNFFLLNWKKLKHMPNQDLFFERRPSVNGDEPYIDTQLRHAKTDRFMQMLMTYNHGKMPVYADGKLDDLVTTDSLGPLDCLNYNKMLRKAWTLQIDTQYLTAKYENLKTSIQLSTPWDLYTDLIDTIPVNFRDAAINENLLLKAEKQKYISKNLLDTGFKLGKL